MLVSIKISEENYRRLCSLSGKLRKEKQRPVSINETISFLYKRTKISDLAGSWDLTEKETKEIKENLKKGWSKWKIGSV